MKVASPDAETTLLTWLLQALRPTSRTRIKEWLRDGRISVNGTPVTQFDHPLKPGDRLAVSHDHRVAEPAVPILFEDDALIAIDKPAGLLAVATEREKRDTAFARLAAHLEVERAGRPYVVHRLDRETSGILLFARSPEVRDLLQKLWADVKKTYIAIVCGLPNPPSGVVENHLLEGKNLRVRAVPPTHQGASHAITRYRTVATRGAYSRVEVELVTGRKHQIRVHLAGLGCPVIGDRDYGATSDPARRLGLHAWKLAFAHPLNGKPVEIESPVPERLGRMVGEREKPPG